MKGLRTVFLVSGVTLGLALLSLFTTEWVLQHAVNRELSKQPDQIEPFYWWTWTTHTGTPLNSTWAHGPLKLALHPLLLYKHAPNQRHTAFTTNQLGLRGKELDPAHSRPRIVILGGSAAFGSGARNDQETIGALLSGHLQAEVLNAGMIGYGSSQEFAYLLTELLELKPDLVITFDGWNDFRRTSEIPDPKDVALLSSVNGFEQLEQQLELLSELRSPSLLSRVSHSYLILFPRIVDRLKASRLGKMWGVAPMPDQPAERSILTAADVYAHNMAKISRTAISYGYRFLPVLQPATHHVDQYRTFRERARTRLSEQQIAHLDLTGADGLTPDMFLDGVHLNVAGNAVIARHLAEAITARHLLPAQPSAQPNR